MSSSASGPTSVSASPFPADRCGPTSGFRASLVIPARVAHWGLPTPNTDSLSAIPPTCGPSSPAGSPRRSGSRLSPKPSTTALACRGGPEADVQRRSRTVSGGPLLLLSHDCFADHVADSQPVEDLASSRLTRGLIAAV